ncbi:MAG: AraC family transcriptional regulator [Bacteroidales bacterium]|nr:AraC family transcriptional regulator [Bacteroidales bacterium]
MSWAGKKSIKEHFKSLFLREQALSSSLSKERIQSILDKWVEEKGYRLPHRSVSEAAASMGLASSTLYRYFKADGTDFRSWRTRLRLEDAKKLLLEEPESPVSLIGRRVGILDRSNFSRTFKEYTGFTPEAWRKRHI